MSWQEKALSFSCQGEQLIGVLSTPQSSTLTSGVGVVVVVGGPQYRAGSHRQFVQFARALAEAGHSVLRFDARGMGDSTGAQRGFEHLSDDIQAAADTLTAQSTESRKIVLMGLCDGASAALIYMSDLNDARVRGLCLLNPWLRSGNSLARVHLKHYYLRRFFSPDLWRKLRQGQLRLTSISDFLTTLIRMTQAQRPTSSKQSFSERMAAGLQRFGGPVMLAISEADLTAKEFTEQTTRDPSKWQTLHSARTTTTALAGASHTLAERQSRESFERLVIHWLKRVLPDQK